MPRPPMSAQSRTRAGLAAAARRWTALLPASSTPGTRPLEVVKFTANNYAGVPVDVVVSITVRPANPEATHDR